MLPVTIILSSIAMLNATTPRSQVAEMRGREGGGREAIRLALACFWAGEDIGAVGHRLRLQPDHASLSRQVHIDCILCCHGLSLCDATKSACVRIGRSLASISVAKMRSKQVPVPQFASYDYAQMSPDPIFSPGQNRVLEPSVTRLGGAFIPATRGISGPPAMGRPISCS